MRTSEGVYDFKGARQRVQLLTMMYRRSKHTEDEMTQWALAAEVEELEKEIAEAHKARKKAVWQDDPKIKQLLPLV